jgi:hypothetical protein
MLFLTRWWSSLSRSSFSRSAAQAVEVGPGREDLLSPGAQDAEVDPEQGSGRRVDFDDPVGGVQDEDPLAHVLDQDVVGDGEDFQEPVAEHRPEEEDAGEREQERSRVQAPDRGMPGEIEDVPGPGNGDGQDQGPPAALGVGAGVEGGFDEDNGSDKEQEVGVDGVDPDGDPLFED